MKSRHIRRAGLALAAAFSLMFTAACGGGADTGNNSGSNGSSGDQTFLTIPREDMGTFTRNFNPFSPSYLPMTGEAIGARNTAPCSRHHPFTAAPARQRRRAARCRRR